MLRDTPAAVVVAITLPVLSTARNVPAGVPSSGIESEPSEAVCENKLVLDATVEKKLELVAFANVVLPVNEFTPENVLLFASSVDEAAVIVMSAEPLNKTLLILREVCRIVAEPALPPIESEAALPVNPVPAPVNDELVTVPVEVKLPTTVEDAWETKPAA